HLRSVLATGSLANRPSRQRSHGSTAPGWKADAPSGLGAAWNARLAAAAEERQTDADVLATVGRRQILQVLLVGRDRGGRVLGQLLGPRFGEEEIAVQKVLWTEPAQGLLVHLDRLGQVSLGLVRVALSQAAQPPDAAAVTASRLAERRGRGLPLAPPELDLAEHVPRL